MIDIFPPPRGRAKPERLDFLRALETPVDREAFAALLKLAPLGGVHCDKFARNRNLTAQEAGEMFGSAEAKFVATAAGALAFSASEWKRMKSRILETLATLHQRSANAMPNEARVMLEAGIRAPQEAAAALLAELGKEGAIVRDAAGLRLREHVPQLAPADAILWKKAVPMFLEHPMRPPATGDIAVALRLDVAKTESFLVRAARLGLLTRITANRFFLPAALRRYASLVEEAAAANGHVTAAALRDRAGVGRGLAIEVLEYFDRLKFTRRVGDQHLVLRPAQQAFGPEAAGKP